MGSFIFALGSLVLLIPIIYILPLGFTLKGKNMIVITSIFVAGLSLLANMTFDWWLSTGLLVLLVIVSVYVIHSRFAAIIYESKELTEEEKIAFQQDNLFVDDPTKDEQDMDVVEAATDAMETDEATIPPEEDETMSEVKEFEELGELEVLAESGELEELEKRDEIAISLDEIDDLNLEQDDTLGPEEVFPPIVEQDDTEQSVEREDGIDVPAEELSILDDEIEGKEVQSSNEETNEAKTSLRNEATDLVGIEEVLLDDIEDRVKEKDRSGAQFSGMEEVGVSDVTEQTSVIAEMLQSSSEVTATLADEDMMIPMEEQSVELLDEFDEDTAIDAIAPMVELEHIEGESLFNPEEIFVHTADELAEQHERVNLGEDTVDDISVNEEHTREQLQQQMFATIHAQVLVAKDMLNKNEYEQMIKNCLTPILSPMHYYTFASMLTQHYLSTKEYQKLANHLTELQVQYSEYPIIHAEIAYLKTQIAGKVS